MIERLKALSPDRRNVRIMLTYCLPPTGRATRINHVVSTGSLARESFKRSRKLGRTCRERSLATRRGTNIGSNRNKLVIALSCISGGYHVRHAIN